MSGVTRSGAEYYDIHLGFWTNWKYDKVRGATVTMTQESGGLLIAFLAIFIGATGKGLWRVLCLLLHRYFSSAEMKDGVHHQRQLVLRNTETPPAALLQLIMITHAWKGRGGRPFLSNSGIFLLAAVIWGAFSIAGIFSSRVTTQTANEVLLTGKDCNIINAPDNMSVVEWGIVTQPWLSSRATAYLNYAQQCYTNAENSEDCQQYVKPKLPLKVTRDPSCPFDSKMCKVGSLTIDTGFLSSNHDLGINLGPKSEFQIRIVDQCAPLVSQGYRSIHNQTSFPDIPVARYHYGTAKKSNGTLDYIYQVATNFSSRKFDQFDVNRNPKEDYQLGVQRYLARVTDAVRNTNAIELIPELQRTDADTSIYFLSAPGINYVKPVDDAWYSAHTPKIFRTVTGSNITLYGQDEPASALGCIHQAQVCNPNAPEKDRCLPLAGIASGTLQKFPALWANGTAEQEMLAWIQRIFYSRYLFANSIISKAGISSLSARFNAGFEVTGPLPDDQWENEVLRWAGAASTSLQAQFVETAMGSRKQLPDSVVIAPTSDHARKVCQSQRIMSTRYASFSVLGISLIVGIGGIIILLDMFLELLLDYFQRKNVRHNYSRLEWKANSTLQLHRMAHEVAHSGTWSKATDAVPVTLPGEALAAVDITDVKHPIIGSVLGGQRHHGPSRQSTGRTYDEAGKEDEAEKGGIRHSVTGLTDSPPISPLDERDERLR
ncbi:hypothetical protein BU24DRAFT_388882 [Aaosphaeria arxii CBS 175.79]|uniref:Uncharacterized protein n=1 Tax=Aaosphaeria arxii CBS 175.79 TaxID=1450172 RepID=A0A6A5XZ32_9PLEO|nr:uncharacterized protein BU24DRAFT_388882 [Aaosphaeria arxii CBS 175.79]KAF2017544.1 hypothetical protein BU24DRAFT_388882 [Aaosphaeria arxii CBS 175.79]